MGRKLRYHQTFQLIHMNSRRFLAYKKMSLQETKNAFNPESKEEDDSKKQIVDSECYSLSFQHYPSQETLFKISEAFYFQTFEGTEEIMNDHYFNI